MLKKILSYSLMALLMASEVTMSAATTVSGTVSPNTGTLGDEFIYRVEVNLDSNDTIIDMPKPDDFYPFEYKSATKREEENKVITDFSLTIFETGEHEIPRLKVAIESKGETKEFVIVSLPVRIDTIIFPDKKNEARGLKQQSGLIVDKKALFKTIGFWVFLAAIILVIVYFIIKKKKKQQKKVRIITDKRTPQEIAIDALETLVKNRLIEKGDIKEHYVQLTDIIKSFLSQIYDAPISEMTTDEAIQYITLKKNNTTVISAAVQVFQTSDLIKFAKHSVASDVHQECISLARHIINTYSANERDSHNEI